jgi:hypothetical protein
MNFILRLLALLLVIQSLDATRAKAKAKADAVDVPSEFYDALNFVFSISYID